MFELTAKMTAKV